jgi:hypothetical protein
VSVRFGDGRRGARPGLTWALLAVALLLRPTHSLAADLDRPPSAVLEFGAAGERSLTDHASASGPSVAVEVTPIEDWLELELGVARLSRRGHTDWETDFLFKKPYTLSRTVELMVGVGPVWSHAKAGGRSSDSAGVEAVLDVMVWPASQHRFGWFVEPSYGYSLAKGHERSIGVSAGLLVAIP